MNATYYLIACDANLDVIGEFRLNSDYNIHKSFVAGDHGVQLFNEAAYTVEETVRFDRLVIP
jgi:hypothetical protein